MELILTKIKEYQRIIITRHIRPDGDAIGSSKGLCEIIRASFPEKEVYVQTNDSSDLLSFLGPDDDPIEKDKYFDSLVIILDTSVEDRISNSYYKTAKEIIKIDHHIDIKPFGNICWIEDFRSSTCEMIAFFYQKYKEELKMTQKASELLYTGIITDSGRFRYSTTKGDTLRLAAMLVDNGVDLDYIYSHLYLEDFNQLKFQAYIYDKIQTTTNGVVYIFVDDEMKDKFNLTNEKASESISYLTTIKNCLVQLAFISNSDSTIRVRLRSRFIPINSLAEKFGGGGHKFASGATLNKEIEIKQMIDDADKMVADYKANNKGWL